MKQLLKENKNYRQQCIKSSLRAKARNAIYAGRYLQLDERKLTTTQKEMKPLFFSTQLEFRKWLSKNHKTESELLVGFYKVKSNKPSMTWSQSVDEALCFGWIDGVRKSIDDESYFIRFTPRKSTSIWSAVNIKKMEVLIENGLMQPSGLKIYKSRTEKKSKIYAYEQKIVKLSSTYEKVFKSNKKAWDFFSSQAPSYQKKIIHRIMSAKQEKTRISRLEKAIKESEQLKKYV